MNQQSLQARLRDAEQQVRRSIKSVRSRLDSLEGELNGGRILNDLGALQQLGPQLDAAVAILATLRDIQRTGMPLVVPKS